MQQLIKFPGAQNWVPQLYKLVIVLTHGVSVYPTSVCTITYINNYICGYLSILSMAIP